MHLHRLDLNKCSNSFYQNLVTVEGQKCETEWPLSDVCLRNRNTCDFYSYIWVNSYSYFLTWYGLPEPGERVVRVPVMTMARVGLSGHSLGRREVQPGHVLTLKHVALQHVNMSYSYMSYSIFPQSPGAARLSGVLTVELLLLVLGLSTLWANRGVSNWYLIIYLKFDLRRIKARY